MHVGRCALQARPRRLFFVGHFFVAYDVVLFAERLFNLVSAALRWLVVRALGFFASVFVVHAARLLG